MHKEIKIDCDAEAECEELVWLDDEENAAEIDGQDQQHKVEKVYIIHKEADTN